MTALPMRLALLSDAPAMASLLTQMGKPATTEQAESRLRVLLGDASRRIVVALDDERVVGLAVGEVGWGLARDEPVARLAVLVTDESVRGRGFGRALVRDFEEWSRSRGARLATLTSAQHREQAHGFYRSCGWISTGLRFAKTL